MYLLDIDAIFSCYCASLVILKLFFIKFFF